jgi:UDP-N-acetylmuramate dehydrogenase
MNSIKEILPGVKENILLSGFTTFKIGGKARYFFEAKNKEDLISAVKAAKKFKMPVFILGGGSNVLFSDKGFKGLIVKINYSDFKIEDNKIYTGAGIGLSKLAKISQKESLSGLEWAVGIPGTLGGAIFGNAQAFGERMSDSINSVEALNLKTLETIKLPEKQCRFKTKNSVFKKTNNFIIISAILKLKKGNKNRIDKKIKENLSYRKKSHPLNVPSAGSVFINTEGKIRDKKILKDFPKLIEYNKWGIIHSGFLIEACGLKGKKIGKAAISQKHGNFIVNLGGAKAKDILSLVELAKQKVKRKFNVDLREEIIILKEK